MIGANAARRRGGTGTLENGRICHRIARNIIALTSFAQHRKTGASCGIENRHPPDTIAEQTAARARQHQRRLFTQKPARCLRRGKSNDVVVVV